MGTNSQTARIKPGVASNPKVYNLSMPNDLTEYPQALSESTKKIMIRMRNKSRCRVSFFAGDTLTNYITLEAGAVYFEENLELTSFTLYLKSESPSQIAEILEWT